MEQNYPFLILSVLSGEGKLDGEPLKKGEHLLLPADYGMAELSGEMELILSTTAEPEREG